MKISNRKNFFIISGVVIVIAFIGYFFFCIPDINDTLDNTILSELPDDEMIIVSVPETKGKDENIFDKLFDRLGIISIEDGEIPLASSSLNASDVGMIPNDKSKALINANILIRSLNINSRIVIDDKYYVTTPSELLTAEDIEITGTDNAEIIVDNDYSSKLFDPDMLKSIIMRNVKFSNLNRSSAFLVVYNDKRINSRVEKVDIQDCTFAGNISLYRQYGNTDLDPDQVDFGIGDFTFKNNIVLNTKFSFIVLVNIPINQCVITGNTINNFTYTFLSRSVSSDAPYSYKLYDRAYLEVDHNKVVCDDDWWGETSSGLYYTFVLFEGDEVLYNNNHVEGMKTKEDFAVYDAYLSARLVNYTNNTWKNNICFASDKTNNTLLKSKKGGSKPLIRNYTGNKFIVEEDFAERVGQSKDNLHVDFISLTQYAESYNIRDNLFDVYDLRFPSSSTLISNFSFSGNNIKAKKSSGNLAIVRINDGYDVDSIDISNNTIEIESKSDKYFNLIKMVNANSDNSGSIKKITVSNNEITAPFGYLFYDVLTDDITFTDNTIIDTGNEYSGFAYNGKFTKSNIASNKIVSSNSVTFFEGRQLYGDGVKKEVLNLSRNNYVSGNNGMLLDVNYNSETPTTYKRSYAFSTPEETYEFYFTFTLNYNPALKCAEATFANSKGETKTYRLGEGNTSSNGNGQFIEIISQNGTEKAHIPFKVRFFNNNERAGFYITEYTDSSTDTKIETLSYKSNDQSSG